jgi:hypothetical protein
MFFHLVTIFSVIVSTTPVIASTSLTDFEPISTEFMGNKAYLYTSVFQPGFRGTQRFRQNISGFRQIFEKNYKSLYHFITGQIFKEKTELTN